MKANTLYTPENIKHHIEATFLKHGPKWFMNCRLNAPLIQRDLSSIRGNDTVKMAVLCASGRSLENDVDVLKAAQKDKSTHIYSSPTNWSFLRANGITPDYLVSIDGSDPQAEVLGEEDIRAETTLLACPFTCHSLVRLFSPRHIAWFLNRIRAADDKATGYDRFVDAFGANRITAWMFPHIRTSLIQAGNVSNTMLLLVHGFVQSGTFPYERIVLAGWDFGRQRVSRYVRGDNGWQLREGDDSDLLHNVDTLELTLPDKRKVKTDIVNVHYATTFYFLFARDLAKYAIETLSTTSLLSGIPLFGSGKQVKDKVATAQQWYNTIMKQLEEVDV